VYQAFYRAQYKFTTITSNPTKMPGMGMAISGPAIDPTEPAKVINGIVGIIGAKRDLDAGILARDEKNH
jgi:hypothetical protein